MRRVPVSQTENATPAITVFPLRPRAPQCATSSGSTRSSLSHLLAWTVPGATLAEVQALGQQRRLVPQKLGEKPLKYALRPPAIASVETASTASTASTTSPSSTAAARQPKPKAPRRTATARTSGSGRGQPLPTGWREEVRVPQSGRKYTVYVGPRKGQYAESHAKAWEAYERFKRIEAGGSPIPEDEYDPVTGAKRKRARRICLACDLGRKRRCSCGKRSRGW